MKADIYELKADVISLFEGLLTLITDTADDFHSKTYKEKLNLEIDKIETLELRMTITAPMKAGKSTIINSLIGREILPNRPRAMTTIPTEIVFNPNLKYPILKISNASVVIFNNYWNKLKNNINTEERFKNAESKISEYDHLYPLLVEIRDASKFPINLETQKDDQIRNSLEKLNDLIRLGSIIIKQYISPLEYLSDIPRIETPFVRIRGLKHEEMLGKFVIVDTPGIDDMKVNSNLIEVIKKELNNSSLVLLVLDYYNLDSQINDDVRRNVQNFQQNVQNVQDNIVYLSNEQSNSTKTTDNIQSILKDRGSKKLYVIVNRIDQRKLKDEEEEKDKTNIKNFVYSRYGLSEVNNPNQLFEISAIRALRTNQLWLEMQKYPNKDIASFESLIPFLKESCGDAWEMIKNQLTTPESLDNFASSVWKKSGFDVFLENAIDDLMLKAAPIRIEDILVNTRKILIEWQNPLKLRISANSKTKEDIEDTIKLLKDYLNEIQNNFESENISNELKNIIEKIEGEINVQLEKVKKESEASLNDFFLNQLLIKFRNNENKVIAFFLQIDLLSKKGLWEFSVNTLRQFVNPSIQGLFDYIDKYFDNSIPASVLAMVKYKMMLKGVNEVSFENQEEAEEFRDSATADACKIFKKHLNELVSECNKIIDLNQKEIDTSLINRTKISLKRVLDHLNDKFDLGLKLPTFIEKDIVDNSSSNFVTISERKKNLLHRGFDWIRRLVSSKNISPNILCISLETMVNEMNVEFDNQFTEIQQSMFKSITDELRQSIDEFSANLQKKMKSLQEALEQTLEDKLQEQNHQEDLMSLLNSLLDSSNKYKADVDEKIVYIQEFKGGK